MTTNGFRLEKLVDQLRGRGVQLWHNRGRLYYGPTEIVADQERLQLAGDVPRVIAYLKQDCHPVILGEHLVAPCGGAKADWRGRLVRQPWQYELAVCLPHLECLDLLDTALACWRHQTVSPYLIVVDTGSSAETRGRLERRRNVDCEIHYVAAHAWHHSSAPVSAACDLATAVCQCPYLLYTHCDVFPRRYDLLDLLLAQVSPAAPVLGYQMSPRPGTRQWMETPSHTLTLCHVPWLLEHRITWTLRAACHRDDAWLLNIVGWPDTESQFGFGLRAEGLEYQCLGPEVNQTPYETDLLVHWRSAPTLRHYMPAEAKERLAGLDHWLQATREAGIAASLPLSAGTPAKG